MVALRVMAVMPYLAPRVAPAVVAKAAHPEAVKEQAETALMEPKTLAAAVAVAAVPLVKQTVEMVVLAVPELFF